MTGGLARARHLPVVDVGVEHIVVVPVVVDVGVENIVVVPVVVDVVVEHIINLLGLVTRQLQRHVTS